jgi:hypothetical protein
MSDSLSNKRAKVIKLKLEKSTPGTDLRFQEEVVARVPPDYCFVIKSEEEPDIDGTYILVKDDLVG